jgi:hypothetical protein
VVFGHVLSDDAGWGDWGVMVLRVVPHLAFGHLLPPRGAGEGDRVVTSLFDLAGRLLQLGLLPLLPAREGGRRPNEGMCYDS